MPEDMSPAEQASEKALAVMYECLDSGESFRLEAGAGAGKTYSLEKALDWLIEHRQTQFGRQQKRVACITYTNVAKDEINDRTDRNPLFQVDTIHSFCWSLIKGFQKQLREIASEMEVWIEKLEEVDGIQDRSVDYNLGHRFITDHMISLHHDDVIPLMARLMENPKFRNLLTSKYPVILIDEYQDTDAQWIAAITEYYLGNELSPQFGFFGDHWQKIYGSGCGSFDHPAVREIGKMANFRSVQTIVEKLNNMRPQLPQHSVDPESMGDVNIFHTNGWVGERRGGGHWKGDLPEVEARQAFGKCKSLLKESGWDFESDVTKILMLTHRVLAAEQGYTDIAGTFSYADSYQKPEHPHLQFFKECLEPALDAYAEKRFGAMLEAFNSKLPILKGANDKVPWAGTMQALSEMRYQSTIGEIVSFMQAEGRPPLPDSMTRLELEFQEFDQAGDEEMPRKLVELQKLREIPYTQVIALIRFLEGYSPFETKHGVKGAEFENVLIVFGRGWNRYNFGQMLEWENSTVPADKQEAYERNRNLFYVCCSRAKKRLALLFTQELEDDALQTLGRWFGAETISPLEL